MVARGELDRKHGYTPVIVKLTQKRIGVGGSQTVRRFEIIHPSSNQDHLDYHKAEIYIDDDRNLPIAYRGYDFPDNPGRAPQS